MVGIQHSQSGHGTGIARRLQALAQRIGLFGQERDQGLARAEHRVLQTRGQKRAVGGQAQHGRLVQACAQAVDGLCAGGCVGDQLAQHRVVVRRDHRTRVQRMVKAQTPRRCKGQHRAGLRREVFVLGAQAHLDGVALQLHIGLRQRQRLAACDAQLPLDQVKPREQLGHRVLHLQPGVHLHQIKRLVGLGFIEQKLHRARTHIARRFRQCNGRLPELLAQCGRHDWAGRFFDDLLVATLHRAIALTQVDAMALRVGHDLHLDMTGPQQGALQQQVAVAKTGQRFGAGAVQGGQQLGHVGHQAHATPAAPGHGFDHQRQAQLLSLCSEGGIALVRAKVARQTRHAVLQGQSLGGRLAAQRADGLRGRPGPSQTCIDDRLGELGVFAQEAIARVYRVSSAVSCGLQQLVDAQVRIGR